MQALISTVDILLGELIAWHKHGQTRRHTATWLIVRIHGDDNCRLSLRGCNMTVGQLVSTMRANGLNPEEAAADLDLPLAQIHEALAYYATHRDLIDEELREDRKRLRAKGYAVEAH